MRKKRFENKPFTFERYDKNKLQYRFNIEQVEETVVDEDEAEKVEECYYAHEVIIPLPIEREELVERVINHLWGNGVEQKLINDYNSAQRQIIDKEEANIFTQRYDQFLEQRKEIKEEVNRDMKEYRIFENNGFKNITDEEI